MKILITNNSLSQLAGSELFCYTLALQLKKFNHDIHMIAFDEPKLDFIICKELTEKGIKILSSVDDLDKDYDVIHCHHNNITNAINYFLPNTPKIFVSHGVKFSVCVPNLDIDFYKVIAVSEEVKRFLEEKHDFKNVEVINNPVDTDKYKLFKKEFKTKKGVQVCFASNHLGRQCHKAGISCDAFAKYKQPYFLEHCYQKCDLKPLHNILNFSKKYKALLFNIGGTSFVNQDGKIETKDNTTWNVNDAYKAADFVCSIGRSALQAMSMGIPTMIYDHFGYAGFVKTKEQFYQLMKTNFSGRKEGFEIGGFPVLKPYRVMKEYKEMLKGDTLKEISELVKKEYDAEMIAKKYISLYIDAIKSKQNGAKQNGN